jgi:hypothetical protein
LAQAVCGWTKTEEKGKKWSQKNISEIIVPSITIFFILAYFGVASYLYTNP